MLPYPVQYGYSLKIFQNRVITAENITGFSLLIKDDNGFTGPGLIKNLSGFYF